MSHLDDFREKLAKPWRRKYVQLRLEADQARAENDPHSAAALLRQARVVNAHLRRLEKL